MLHATTSSPRRPRPRDVGSPGGEGACLIDCGPHPTVVLNGVLTLDKRWSVQSAASTHRGRDHRRFLVYGIVHSGERQGLTPPSSLAGLDDGFEVDMAGDTGCLYPIARILERA